MTPYTHTTLSLQGVPGVTRDHIPVIPSGQDLQDELDGYLCSGAPLVHMVIRDSLVFCLNLSCF